MEYNHVDSNINSATIDINVIPSFNNSKMVIPEYVHLSDSGFDLRANLKEDEFIELAPGHQVTIPTGLYVQMPLNTLEFGFVWEIQIRPRSGLAHKKGVSVRNSPGTIDAGYTNEIGVILYNGGDTTFLIDAGDRIAQGVLAKSYKATFNVVSEFVDTDRGLSGFGDSGVK